jgi:uncharacterized protein YybS (DUF2232 family)
MSDPYAVELENWLEHFKEIIARFLPGILGSIFLLISLTNILVSKKYMFRNFKEEIFAPKFTHWQLPNQLIWIIIIIGGLILFGKDIFKFKFCGENALLVFGTMYFLQGLAIFAFYFDRLKVPAFLRWFTYILLCVHWYGLLSIIIIGLSNVWFDLRARAPAAR